MLTPMVAEPLPTAVTVPLPLTLATEASDVFQVALFVTSLVEPSL